jgi:hypothetical protein
VRRFRSVDRDFDSTTAGTRATVKARSVDGRTCGGEARSPRHTGPRSSPVTEPSRINYYRPGSTRTVTTGGTHMDGRLNKPNTIEQHPLINTTGEHRRSQNDEG